MNNINTALAVFKFKEFQVRTVVKDGEPWFVAADLCEVLGVKNHRESVRHLDDDEKGVISNDTHGGMQQISIVSESGLYALVLRSRKPEARKFAKWVTSEVLPSIRKTGKFDVNSAPGPLTKEMQQAIKEMVIERAKVLPHEKQAAAIIKAWSALKSHFGVTYKLIPVEKYTEALSLVARMQVEWEVVEPAALTESKIDPGLRKSIHSLLNHMEFLRSWWAKYGPGIQAMNEKTAADGCTHFVDGASVARTIARQIGYDIPTKYAKNYPWNGDFAARQRYNLENPA